jgi:membrane protein
MANAVQRPEPAQSSWASAVERVRNRYRGTAAQQFFHELGEVEFFDQTMLVGAGLLISLIPFLILLSAFASHRVDTDIELRLGLDHQGAAIVNGLFHSSPAELDVGTATSLLFMLLGALTVTGAIQQIYERVFGLPHRRSVPRLFVWTLALVGAFALESLVGRPVRNEVGGAGLVDLLTFAIFAPFFWWTLHYLLANRVPWRELWRPALATGFCFAGLGLFSKLYFASSLVSDSKAYGPVGAVLTITTWLIAIASVIVIGAVAGHVWESRHS